MNQKRVSASSVQLNASVVWVLGGEHQGGSLDSTEFISLDGAIPGPQLPIRLTSSCAVKFNDYKIYILGGIQNGSYYSDTVWEIDLENGFQFTFTKGPSMIHGRYSFGCGTMYIGNNKVIVAVGGMGYDIENHQIAKTVEILDPSKKVWEPGK